MTKPLTEEIAKEYGYGIERFTEWAKAYCLSLDVEGRMDKVKPIKQTSNTFRKSYIIKKVAMEYGNMWILNPNYIYIITDSYDYESGFYIPVEKPFSNKSGFGREPIAGIYYKFGALSPMYTSGGFNYESTFTIEGVLDFPLEMAFMNWKENPF